MINLNSVVFHDVSHSQRNKLFSKANGEKKMFLIKYICMITYIFHTRIDSQDYLYNLESVAKN